MNGMSRYFTEAHSFRLKIHFHCISVYSSVPQKSPTKGIKTAEIKQRAYFFVQALTFLTFNLLSI
jgi:hypothetical protein